MSIDWSGYTGEDKGCKRKTEKQYVSEKTIADVWNDHVTIGGKDYPYLPPLQ